MTSFSSLPSSVSPALDIQQLVSVGQNASESISSQNNANKPLTHSPLHNFSGFSIGASVGRNFCTGFDIFCGGFVFDLIGSTVVGDVYIRKIEFLNL